ncbi:RNA methyltransferase [bacterium]|nr:RNA methyltransferase [bacterium]MDC1109207.1 RNA methyltransferase [Flavobacteriaceae bacterium]
MVSDKQIKIIKSLKLKKNRIKHNLFVAEGDKTILELITAGFNINSLYSINRQIEGVKNSVIQLSKPELNKMSNLSNPKNSLGVFEIPKPKKINYNKLIIGLDNISDPGNLGTIIRLCDWFGVEDLICSFDTVDCYNPKVIQASMGSISRVNITYLDLQKTLENNSLKTYGTYMQGDSIFEIDEIKNGVILFGNEANGINLNLSKFIDKRLSIPRFGKLKKTESLNVANALSIVLSENSRKSTEK